MRSFARPSFFAALGAAIGLLIVSGVSRAQTPPPCAKVASNQLHVCWLPVVNYTDGTAIPSTATVTYSVLRYTNSAWTPLASGITGLDWTSGPLPAGEYRIAVTATVANETGARSTTNTRTMTDPPAPKPAAPIITIAQLVDGKEVTVATLDLGYPYVIRLPQVASK